MNKRKHNNVKRFIQNSKITNIKTEYKQTITNTYNK